MLISCLIGSVWLLRLSASTSRPAQHFSSLVSRDPWTHGWDLLWESPALYVCVPIHARLVTEGLLAYGGETTLFPCTVGEHEARILAPTGAP